MDSILKPPEDLKLRNLTSGVSLPLKRVGGDIPGIPWGPVSPQTPSALPQQLRLPFLSAAAMFASPGGATVAALLWVGDGDGPSPGSGVGPGHRPPSASCFPLPRTSGTQAAGSPGLLAGREPRPGLLFTLRNPQEDLVRQETGEAHSLSFECSLLTCAGRSLCVQAERRPAWVIKAFWLPGPALLVSNSDFNR